ncbi:MAG: FG-GAP repeat domain-containing protein, partial [Phycisphaerales bacterium JB040]
DGTTDLVTSNPGNDTVTILRGVGDGTFINASSYLARPGASGAGVGVREVKLADLNADGHDDAVVSTSDHAVVMYNTGSGGFFSGEFALYLPAGSNVRSVDVGDLNADNAPDIVAADRNANTVRVFRNNSDGTYPTFTQIASVPTPGAPISVVLADLGGASPPPLHADRAGDPAPMPALAPDGDLDIIVNGENDDAVRVALNDGTGAFTVFDDYDNTVFSPERMAVGDLDNDGDQDLAVPGLAGGLDVFLNASPGVGGPAPIARIDLPNDFTAGGCVSGIVSVQGVSYVPAPGAFDRDELWYRQLADPTFTQIGTATTPLETSGPLYNWDTSALDEGYYLVQLRTYSATGLSDTDEQVLYLSTQFDTLSVSVGSLVGGTVCINGTVNDANGAPIEYTVDYRATGSGDAFTPVNPASPTYAGPRINQGLAAWDSTTVPDGLYDIRVAASNGCGQRREFNTTIEVDNTAPEAVILDPTNCDSVIPGQTVPITGIADDLNFRTWTLQYTGGDANGWVTIDSGNTPVLAGLITEWKTTGLRPCSYTLRLLVSEDTITNCDDRRVSEFLTSVEVRCPADINADGVLDNGDISTFVSLFLAGCSP